MSDRHVELGKHTPRRSGVPAVGAPVGPELEGATLDVPERHEYRAVVQHGEPLSCTCREIRRDRKSPVVEELDCVELEVDVGDAEPLADANHKRRCSGRQEHVIVGTFTQDADGGGARPLVPRLDHLLDVRGVHHRWSSFHNSIVPGDHATKRRVGASRARAYRSRYCGS